MQGFRNHVKYDHNMWDYVYYSFYLDSIDTGDHNAIQKYVYEQVSIIRIITYINFVVILTVLYNYNSPSNVHNYDDYIRTHLLLRLPEMILDSSRKKRLVVLKVKKTLQDKS